MSSENPTLALGLSAIASCPHQARKTRAAQLSALGALAAVALSGCGQGDPREPFTDSRIPPGLESRFYPPDGWTWGLVRTGDAPAARYGVSAPAGTPAGDVLILTAYGEPAEIWFETVRELNARGLVVWVLEPVGQGGSGRYGRVRDLGHADNFEPDVQGLRTMADKVVRRRPLILMASGTSAPAAAQALARGLRADAAILSSPRLAPPPPSVLAQAATMQRIGLAWLRADLHGGWSRKGPDDLALGLTHDAARGKLRLAWQTANPDLRMGSPSWAWTLAFAQAAQAADVAAPRVGVPVLVLKPDHDPAAADGVCRRMPHCTVQTLAGTGQALELETDAVRRPWLSAVQAFVARTIGDFPPPSARARLSPDGPR